MYYVMVSLEQYICTKCDDEKLRNISEKIIRVLRMISKISTHLLEINSIQITPGVNPVPAALEANTTRLNKRDVCVTVRH